MKKKNRKNDLCQPILKWVGGKRQLLPEILKYVPEDITTYYEPFVGGGALFFYLQHNNAIVNDFNEELINLYNVIKNNPLELIEELKKYPNNAEFFYKIRGVDRSELYNDYSDVQRAARIHYLNKTCYNGLYRVNSSGEFNTPFGRYKNPNIVNEDVILSVHDYFVNNNISILNGDYENSLINIKKGSFVYFDPPYDPISSSSSFTGYTEIGFSKEDQTRLKRVCDQLNSNGVRFLLSNSDTEFIRKLYESYDIVIVSAKRSINSNSDKRGGINEVLIKNY